MNSFLIKIGKAWNTLKQEGFFSGGKKVLKYSSLYFKALLENPEGDVLFLTMGLGDSARYRAFNQAEELNLKGIRSSVMITDNPRLSKFANLFKVFIFNRTLVTKNVQELILEIKKQNKEIIFDTDDLVFDAKFMHQSESYQKMNSLQQKQYKKGVGEEIINDPYVKTCTTTTSFIKNILENQQKNVFLSLNKINKREVAIAENINGNKKQEYSNEIKIGYFSGTMSHNKDFASISEPLYQIMEKYPQVKLTLVGPLNVDDKLNNFKDRIYKSKLASIKKHYENISGVDINLAPLEKNSPFCEAKSELKFFEAGIVKTPTVAIKNQTFSGAIEDGVDGFLAETDQEWFEKLEKLILDENLRKGMGEKAYRKTLEEYTTKNAKNEEYYNYLKNKL